MNTHNSLIPLDATHPGEVINDELIAQNIPQSELAQQIGYKKSQLNEIIKGKRKVNADLALLLEKALGIDADYWLDLQKNYDLDKAKINLKNQKRQEAIEQWRFLKDNIATSLFKKEKLLSGDPIIDIPKIKDIYGVSTFDELANINAQPAFSRFRKSDKLKVDPINVIGWVKLVQYEADKMIIDDFDHEDKDLLINRLREILNKNHDTLRRVKLCLEEFGIKLIYQQKGEKSPIDGIAFWSNGSPAIGMTLRHKRLDNYAFTLFHELGHVYEHLLNSNNAEFVDLIARKENQEYKKSKEEKEANIFAQENLIDQKEFENFFDNTATFTDREIKEFAQKARIHPSIVRGQVCFRLNFYGAKTDIDYTIY